MSNSKTTETENKLISINAALTERGHLLGACEEMPRLLSAAKVRALKAQIRDLETEKHALLQALPL